LVFMILNIMQKDKDNIKFVSDRLGHDYRYALNSNKAIRLIENEFKSDFENMLINTINWYREHPHIWDIKSKK